ncbi:M61 family metallopeptidase, partial [Aquabacterium sp.]|uniref:M61 family metallopeptidase n=1 Tax=Aquabacterium sp. TaxID=1872578 RepID=UPI002BA0AEC7
MRRWLAAASLTCVLFCGPTGPALAQDVVGPAAYPGLLQVAVNATDLDHRVFSVRQTLPVASGPLTLFLPRWLPGTHSPSGEVTRLAGLVMRAGGQVLPWQRDPLDAHAFQLTVPAGVQELVVEFQHLAAVTSANGRVVMTPEMLNLQWHNLLLYPAGHAARNIQVQASLSLPAGWQSGSALRAERTQTGKQTGKQTGTQAGREADTITFKPVSVETLVDSPVFAGRHFRRIALESAAATRPVVLNIVADTEQALQASEAQIDAHRRLVQQADKLFGARHFQKYDFLLALSEELGGIGLEHHESSENGVDTKYFEGWDKSIGARELLAHEYVHSWNGKYRRPADLLTPHFNVPMQNSLLWVYEGQTEFWGHVLAARAGLSSPALARDRLAQHAAAFERRAGRAWRNLQDTTHDNLMGARGRPKDWSSWQRSSGDYYIESLLIWLDVDTLIREKSGGQRSMDDFARAFYGSDDGQLGPRPYTFDEVVATLNAVLAHDWAGFLRERLDGHARGAPLDGLARGGWQLAWSDAPSDNFKAGETRAKASDFSDSLGLRVASD